MYKDKNYGLPEDLLETVKSVVLENKIESEFKKYLDENFHVEQLTEEEIQWIFENEFVQLNEGLGLALRGAYEVGKRLLPRIFKGGSKAGPKSSSTGAGAGGNQKLNFDQVRRTAQTLSTQEQKARQRKIGASVLGGTSILSGAAALTGDNEKGSASAGTSPKSTSSGADMHHSGGTTPKSTLSDNESEKVKASRKAMDAANAAGPTGTEPPPLPWRNPKQVRKQYEKHGLSVDEFGRYNQVKSATRVQIPTPSPTPSKTKTKQKQKPAARTRTRRPRPSRSSSGQSWAQRQHSGYSTGGPSIFTSESFSHYLHKNFHVEQLTEEEIQWIYENEFISEQRSVAELEAEISQATNPNFKLALQKRLEIARRRESKSKPGSSEREELDKKAEEAKRARAVSTETAKRNPTDIARQGASARTREAGSGSPTISDDEFDQGGEQGSSKKDSEIRKKFKEYETQRKERAGLEFDVPGGSQVPKPESKKTNQKEGSNSKPAARTRTRRPRPSRSSSGQSWAQRQHSRYSIGKSSIFTPES